MKRAILILGFLLVAGNAQAWNVYTGLFLYNHCGSSLNENKEICQYYMQGVLEGHLKTVRSTKTELLICIKAGTLLGELPSILRSYARKHPDLLAGPPVNLAFGALMDLWPCEKNN